jgi:hypothetical protein
MTTREAKKRDAAVVDRFRVAAMEHGYGTPFNSDEYDLVAISKAIRRTLDARTEIRAGWRDDAELHALLIELTYYERHGDGPVRLGPPDWLRGERAVDDGKGYTEGFVSSYCRYLVGINRNTPSSRYYHIDGGEQRRNIIGRLSTIERELRESRDAS